MRPQIKPATETRILLIEEHDGNVVTIRKALENLGIDKIITASSGSSGIQMLGQDAPDLILMDCSMSGLDGYDAARLIRMKENESGNDHHIPIIGMTANTSKTAKDNCMLAGMDGCVHKPIDPIEMHRLLSDYIQLRGLGLNIQVNVEDDPRLDLKIVGQFAYAGSAPLHMLITAFIEDSLTQLKQLELALAAKDAQTWAQGIHALRAMSANIGARELEIMANHRQERLPGPDIGQVVLEQLEGARAHACTVFKAYLEKHG